MPKIVDLTHILHNNVPVFPGSSKPLFQLQHNIPDDGYAETSINMLSHHGTHMDAPAHMILNGKTLDRFEPSKFYGKAICIDCTGIGSVIELSHLLKFEKTIQKVSFVLFYTGWSEKWGSEAYFSDFPVLSDEACKWISKFSLNGIGLDNISADPINTRDYVNHYTILGKEMVIVENLANLRLLDRHEFTFSCFPLHYQNADGAPVRVVAIF